MAKKKAEDAEESVTEAAPKDYPRWKYSREHAPCIVHSAAEEASLGEGWDDVPTPDHRFPPKADF